MAPVSSPPSITATYHFHIDSFNFDSSTTSVPSIGTTTTTTMPSITTTTTVAEFEYNDSAEYHYAQFRAGNTNPYEDAFRAEYYIGPRPQKKKESKLERLFKKIAQKLE
jgi:hypothetical protein